jgi:hypothetical protein
VVRYPPALLQLATRHNLVASDEMQQQFNRKAAPYHYFVGQLVFLDEQNFLGRNRKLAPKWTGPHTITQEFDNGVVQLRVGSCQLRVNVARIKPYIKPIPHTPQAADPLFMDWSASDASSTAPPQLPPRHALACV